MTFCTNFTVLNILLFIIGIAILLKGSDWFVDAASALAKRLKVSELIIGLTVVSIGTSLPELATNVIAAICKNSAIAYGNIVGSNITNVMLILGIGSIMMGRIAVPSSLFKRDGLIMLGMTILTLGSAVLLGGLPRWAGFIYIILLAIYFYILCRDNKKELMDSEDIPSVSLGLWASIGLLIVGLLMVFAGAKMVVDNTIWISHKIGISQTIIAVTVVALGTSLPELAVTLAGIVKKREGIALGNIVGSNIFNMMLILGASAIIHPLTADPSMRSFNLPMLLVSDAMLLIFMRWGWSLNRYKGVVLLLGYIFFIFMNFKAAL